MEKKVNVSAILKEVQSNMEQEGKDTALKIAKGAGRVLGGFVGTIFGAGVLAAKATGRGTVSLVGKIKSRGFSIEAMVTEDLQALKVGVKAALDTATPEEAEEIEVCLEVINKELAARRFAGMITKK
jgi:hypothetical protein